MEEFISIAIIGALLSVIYEWLAKSFTDPVASKLGIIIASIILGTAYTLIRDTEYYQTVLLILGSASTFYGLFINKRK